MKCERGGLIFDKIHTLSIEFYFLICFVRSKKKARKMHLVHWCRSWSRWDRFSFLRTWRFIGHFDQMVPEKFNGIDRSLEENKIVNIQGLPTSSREMSNLLECQQTFTNFSSFVTSWDFSRFFFEKFRQIEVIAFA